MQNTERPTICLNALVALAQVEIKSGFVCNMWIGEGKFSDKDCCIGC